MGIHLAPVGTLSLFIFFFILLNLGGVLGRWFVRNHAFKLAVDVLVDILRSFLRVNGDAVSLHIAVRHCGPD